MLSALVHGLLEYLFFRPLGYAYLPYNHDYYGLGNRIKGIANFYALGYRKFLVAWKVTGWVTSPFKDLFVLDRCKVAEFNDGTRPYLIIPRIIRRFIPAGIVTDTHPFWSFRLPESFKDARFLHKWSFRDEEIYSIDWRYTDIPSELRARFMPFFKALKPSVAVQKRCASCPVDRSYVAVHIRNSGLKEDQKAVCSVGTIVEAMKQYPATTKFFISAMNAEIAAVFHAEFGGRVTELPDKRYKSMIDATADMWLLGQCGEMICSPSSTFSEVAWWWGGGEIPVTMLKSEYNQRVL